MSKLYWLAKNNTLIRVEGHYELFEGRFIKKYSKENYYDMLAKQGYLRLVETQEGMIICFNENNSIADKQLEYLKNHCIESRIKLFYEINPLIQKSEINLREISL